MIGVIDYGAGNLGSVMNALKRLSVPARFAAGPEELLIASSPFEKIIFPGDGHFATAMASITRSGYSQAIKEWIQADKPFLGICIGLQLLFETSDEARNRHGEAVLPDNAARPDSGECIDEDSGFFLADPAGSPSVYCSEVRGLSVIPGTVRRFPGRKVPQIGWNQTTARSGSKIFRGLSDNSFFYYIHSYYADPSDDSVRAAQTEYYVRYCCAVERGALAAVQFHPEKSGAAGLVLLRNWTEE
ncbi:MAG: imidazole glycerol phosphate synthase subunit HisH [Treponema sp.]|jgi:imidazoleglycerol phosphate synthase glutamine amidotransferase subunit HisH|nr:imidazole glycerol phosphate synthase subunit HisH [Treponema sp.]